MTSKVKSKISKFPNNSRMKWMPTISKFPKNSRMKMDAKIKLIKTVISNYLPK
jgi:hypothetical protein